jgi:eukaryotic-like serine/threonine-protein kinase
MQRPPPTPERTGTVLVGRYELRAVIGRGGHGTVWRAHDRSSGRSVAIKMLNDVVAQDPQHIERLKREQQAMVVLAGTSAVGFVDACRSPGGRLCLVMELLEGMDLEQRLEELEQHGQFISIPELLRVLDPIVDTLDRAHQAGILHRDLKPANIFIMSESAGGGVRLLDFGLARLRSAQPLTAAGMIVGSPSYIAPEVWKGRSDQLDPRCDIYSFGIAVFRALANRLPFEGASLQDKFRMTTTAPRPSLRAFRPDLPEDVDHWVQEVLAIDPEGRFHTIRGAWNALLSSLRAPDFAAHVATASDLQSAAAALAPFLAAPHTGPTGGGPERSIMSEWLAQSDYGGQEEARPAAELVEQLPDAARIPAPFAAPPPEPPEPPRAEASSSSRSHQTTHASDGSVMVAPVVAVRGDPSRRADENQSFVREWLVGSELGEASADSHDVASWLGVTEDAPEAVAPPKRAAPRPPRPAAEPGQAAEAESDGAKPIKKKTRAKSKKAAPKKQRKPARRKQPARGKRSTKK